MAYFSVSPYKAARNAVAYQMAFGRPSERIGEITPSNLFRAMRAAGYDVSEEWARERIVKWYRQGMLDLEDGRLVAVR